MPTFEDLMRTHPQHRGELWAELDLLYRGGSDLVAAIREQARPRDVASRGKELLVRRVGEPDGLYAERCRRAYALPNLPTIVNYFAAVTLADPPVVKESGSETAGGWYGEFQKDVDRNGTDLAEFARRALVCALVTRKAVVIVDWPPPAPVAAGTRYDEDAANARDGWLCPVAPAMLLDWEKDDRGALVWAKTLTVTLPAPSFEQKRDAVVYEWRVFERGVPAAGGLPARPARARMFRLARRKGEGKDTDDVPEMPEVTLRTSRVPVVVLELPDGLWVGGKIGPAEVELLNKQNALSWLEYMTAFAFLKETRLSATGEAGTAPSPTDGVVKTLQIVPGVGSEDIEWVELSGSSIQTLSDRIFKLTEGIYRQAAQLALAAPLGAVDQAASGEAKRRDMKPTAVVCEALAACLRDFAEQVFDVLAEGRGEETEFQIDGLRRFDEGIELPDLLRSGLDSRIPSDTARKEIALRLVDAVLPDLPPDVRARIRGEIAASNAPEPAEAAEPGGNGDPKKGVPVRA